MGEMGFGATRLMIFLFPLLEAVSQGFETMLSSTDAVLWKLSQLEFILLLFRS